MKSKNDEDDEENEQKAADKIREKIKSIYNQTAADYDTLAEYDHFLDEREETIRLLTLETTIEVSPAAAEMSVSFSNDTSSCEVTWVAPNSALSFLGIRADWFTVEKVRLKESVRAGHKNWQDPTAGTVMKDLSKVCLLLRVNKEAIWESISKYKKDHGRQIQQRATLRQRERKQAIAHIIKTEGTFFAKITKNQGEVEDNNDGQQLRHAFERKYEDLMENDDDALSVADSHSEAVERVVPHGGAASKNRKSTNDQMGAAGWPMHAWRRKAEDMLSRLWGY